MQYIQDVGASTFKLLFKLPVHFGLPLKQLNDAAILQSQHRLMHSPAGDLFTSHVLYLWRGLGRRTTQLACLWKLSPAQPPGLADRHRVPAYPGISDAWNTPDLG